MKHKLLNADEEDIEEVRTEILVSGDNLRTERIYCSCYFEKEYGGLPCRHVFRVLIDLKKGFENLCRNVDPFWTKLQTKILNPENQSNN
jgi:hypothetical protein